MFYGALEDLDSPIWVFNHRYTLYVRFCKLREADEDFITLLESDARYEVREHIQTVEVSDGNETRHVRDDRVELAEIDEQFRRVVLETPDGEGLDYLTMLVSSACDPIDVINIYALRAIIEILFRELKQCLNIENFHSQTLNGCYLNYLQR